MLSAMDDGLAKYTFRHSAAAPGIGGANASLPKTAKVILALAQQARASGQRDIFIQDVTTGREWNLVEFEREFGGDDA